MEVKFKKLVPGAKIPRQAYNTDAGYDVWAVSCEYDVERDAYIYNTGVANETPFNPETGINFTAGLCRSSNRNTDAYLTNFVGIVDSDGYRGPIQFTFKNRTSLEVMIQLETMKRIVTIVTTTKREDLPVSLYDSVYTQVKNEYIQRAKNLEFAPYMPGPDKAIGQFIFLREEKVDIVEVDELSPSQRAENGHGSTDQK